jgi:hypothetical protein
LKGAALEIDGDDGFDGNAAAAVWTSDHSPRAVCINDSTSTLSYADHLDVLTLSP